MIGLPMTLAENLGVRRTVPRDAQGGTGVRNSVSARKKASGVEWIGEIPSLWKVRSFRYCGAVPNGQVDPRLPQFREQTLDAPSHIESGTGRLIGTGTAVEQGAESGKITYVGKVIAGWFKRYCDHHGITPDVLNSLRAEHTGLGTAEKMEARKARLFREGGRTRIGTVETSWTTRGWTGSVPPDRSAAAKASTQRRGVSRMNQQELSTLLTELRSHLQETEWVEFKQ